MKVWKRKKAATVEREQFCRVCRHCEVDSPWSNRLCGSCYLQKFWGDREPCRGCGTPIADTVEAALATGEWPPPVAGAAS